jgi:hypothetical protein
MLASDPALLKMQQNCISARFGGSCDQEGVNMAKKSGGKKNGGSKEILVVGSKMKDVIKKAGCMSSGELIEAVSAKVHELLAAAVQRAKTNGRSTVRPYDL